jgi:phosphatidylglycerophosphate synthase
MSGRRSAVARLNRYLEDHQEISRPGLEMIANHKYKSGVYTPLDLLFYKIWWTPVASLLPKWIAPNLITFIGFITTFTNIPLMVHYNPTLESTLPSWVFAYAGFTVFFYITMDAIDGMQARKTNSSSPLGQLFDHGCDCTITTVYSLMMINGLGLGPDWKSVALVVSVQFAFFLSQWEEKYTGTCRTCVMGIFGVTETQLMLMTQMFLSAVYPGIAKMPVYEGWTFSECYVVLYLGFMILVSASCVLAITIKHPSAFRELLSVAVLNLAVFVWSFKFAMQPDEYIVALLALAFNNSFSTSRVIVSSMSHTEFPLYHKAAIPFFVIIAIRLILGYSAISKFMMVFYLGGLLDHIAKALIGIVNEISSYLGIFVFDIVSKRT